MGVHPSRIERAILDIQQQHYKAFRQENPQGLAVDDTIRTFEGTVRKIADGKSIEELDIRRKSGATIVAVERDGEVVSNPGPQFRLQQGDRIHFIGSEQEVGRAISLI